MDADDAAAMRVRAAVREAERQLIADHPWLRHQDAIGLTIQLLAVGGIVACSWAWLQGMMPTWVTILAVAFLASITHEMEHDLIHQLYFKSRPWMQDLLMLLGWLARPTTLSSWRRRDLHFHHHKFSGEVNDLEERAITNGEPWGLRRLLMTLDLHLAIYLRPLTMIDVARRYRETATPWQPRPGLGGWFERLMRVLPLNVLTWAAWHAFLVFHAVDAVASWAGHPVVWSAGLLEAVQVLNAFVVCLIAPNVLRTFCLHFVSSNMHYYGNVEHGKLVQQCQVLNHPLLWPLQVFCFNFGSTHAIHHFVVGQTFYVRQAIAAQAHRAMRDAGVPFNDLGTFLRANRRAVAADPQPAV